MADEQFANEAQDGQLDPQSYGLEYNYEMSMSPWEFDRFVSYIGAYTSNQPYFINILALQGVKVTDENAYLRNNGGTLKLVKNIHNRFDDVVILKYNIPSTTKVLLWTRMWTESQNPSFQGASEHVQKFMRNPLYENYFNEPGGLAKLMGLLTNDLAKPVVDDPHLIVSDSVIRTWQTNFLTPGDHIHIFPATVNPGADADNPNKTAQLGLGQHAFRRGTHGGRYRALNPCTYKSTNPRIPEPHETTGWRKPAEQLHYVDETAGIYKDLSYTNVHYGQNTRVGAGSTGCINIQGWQKDRYEYFMLTAYIHGGPDNPLAEIPVTIWSGVDFFKFKHKEKGKYKNQEHKGLPELHFASHDTRKVRPGWRSRPGWVEKMQKILWNWRGKPAPAPDWGLFDKDTVHRLLWFFQDHAIKNLENKDKTKHYYRRIYSQDPKSWENHSYWDPREAQALKQIKEEKGEAICGPATWEAMRFFCPKHYMLWIKMGGYEGVTGSRQ